MGLIRLFLVVAALALAPSAKALFCNENLYITGGHKVSLKDAPFMASINEADDEHEDEYEPICGGTVIHDRFVLTAASCIDDTEDLGVHVATASGYIGVEEEYCHEDFDAETLANDICLLKLESGIPFARLIQVALPEKNLVLEVGTLVNVTGWGATRRDGDMETELHQVTIPVVKQQCCDDLYEEFSADQLCAGARRRDFCEGDMGGPLTYNGVQVGVISGEGECGKNPGIYTRVTSYLDWINSTITDNL